MKVEGNEELGGKGAGGKSRRWGGNRGWSSAAAVGTRRGAKGEIKAGGKSGWEGTGVVIPEGCYGD